MSDVHGTLSGSRLAAMSRPWDLYSRRQRAAFLAVLFLVGAINYADRNLIGVVLEQIKAEFQVSDTMLGVLSGLSFALFYAVLGIPVARWADRGDRKLVITLSLGVWSLMTALCGMVATFWQLAVVRFGVGAGEAGAIPPAQSLLAAYFSPAQRSRAIGMFMMSSSAGYALGLAAGGSIAEHFGWRATFVAFGAAGFLLLPLVHFVLSEPRRAIPADMQAAEPESAGAAFHVLLAKPAYRNVLCAVVVYFFMSYGAFAFIVALMIRVHGLSVAEAGAVFGAVAAIGATIGMAAGGAIADRLMKRDVAWVARVAAVAMIAAFPLYELALASSHLASMVTWLVLAALAHNAVVPPAFSAIHLVCGSKRRALSVALVFFFANLVGLGLGPVIAGALSDAFSVVHGPGEGLRYALMTVMCALLPAGWLMYRAAPHLQNDAED